MLLRIVQHKLVKVSHREFSFKLLQQREKRKKKIKNKKNNNQREKGRDCEANRVDKILAKFQACVTEKKKSKKKSFNSLR